MEYQLGAQNPPLPQAHSLSQAESQNPPETPLRTQTQTPTPIPIDAATLSRGRAYPKRPQAPQDVLDRGKATYGVSCAFCHGSDARGGEVGPNLLRSAIVLEDQNAELITPIVHGGRIQQGMPRIDISDAQIKDVAAWLHNFNPIGKGTQFHEDINIVTGDAKAGQAYFAKTCSSCHSATGDLAGIATRIPVAKTLQQTWLLPGAGPGAYSAATLGLHIPPPSVTVTLSNGKKISGNLIKVNDFDVSLTTPETGVQTFRRDGDVPKVDLHDPIAAHRELIPKYTDKDIHDVTAYLETLK